MVLNHILLFFSVDIANYELTVLAIATQQLCNYNYNHFHKINDTYYWQFLLANYYRCSQGIKIPHNTQDSVEHHAIYAVNQLHIMHTATAGVKLIHSQADKVLAKQYY